MYILSHDIDFLEDTKMSRKGLIISLMLWVVMFIFFFIYSK